MNEKVHAGHICGIPVVIDATLIIMIVLYSYPYLTSGSPAMVAHGLLFATGGVLSILIHELAHAMAGRLVGCEATHIELNGCGGLCCFPRLFRDRSHDIFVTLAGPASNLALWALFYWASDGIAEAQYAWFYNEASGELVQSPASGFLNDLNWLCVSLASLNIGLFVFNMLPAFPLDGGRALSAAFATRMEGPTANRTVAGLGFGVIALCVYEALKGNTWMLVPAFTLFQANYAAWTVLGRTPWSRWN